MNLSGCGCGGCDRPTRSNDHNAWPDFFFGLVHHVTSTSDNSPAAICYEKMSLATFNPPSMRGGLSLTRHSLPLHLTSCSPRRTPAPPAPQSSSGLTSYDI